MEVFGKLGEVCSLISAYVIFFNINPSANPSHGRDEDAVHTTAFCPVSLIQLIAGKGNIR